tara:strand:+ start:856 stop:1782 length:927 start_codon:yes stop_codon:yes gene_type:complete
MANQTMTSLTHVKRDEDGGRVGAPPLIAFNALIFDVSGSTESMGDAPVEQLHELMNQLKEDATKDDRNIQLSLHTFSSTIKQVFPAAKDENSVDMRTFTIPSIDELREILRPGGCTALYDAGIQGLDVLDRAYDKEVAKIPKSVMALNPKFTKCYVLSTDGYDNTSTASISDFKKKLLEAKKNGVQPLFLSANISTALTEQMGFESNTTAQFQPTYQGMTQMLRATTNALRQYSSGATDTIDSQMLTQDMDPVTPPTPPQYDSNGTPMMPGLGSGISPGMGGGISLRQHANPTFDTVWGRAPPPLRRY